MGQIWWRDKRRYIRMRRWGRWSKWRRENRCNSSLESMWPTTGLHNAGASSSIQARSTHEKKALRWMADYKTGEGTILRRRNLECANVDDDGSREWSNSVWGSSKKENMERCDGEWDWIYLEKSHLGACCTTWRVTPIGVKWVYKTKFNEDGEVEKYKSRLLAKGYAQCYAWIILRSLLQSQDFKPSVQF